MEMGTEGGGRRREPQSRGNHRMGSRRRRGNVAPSDPNWQLESAARGRPRRNTIGNNALLPQPRIRAEFETSSSQRPRPRRVSGPFDPNPLMTEEPSPLSVVRAKRATQLQFEKMQEERLQQQQRSSSRGSSICHGTKIISAPLQFAGSRAPSPLEPPSMFNNVVKFVENIPPPPSPPCTCGKTLVFPPTPPSAAADHAAMAAAFEESVCRRPVSTARSDTHSLDGRLASLRKEEQTVEDPKQKRGRRRSRRRHPSAVESRSWQREPLMMEGNLSGMGPHYHTWSGWKPVAPAMESDFEPPPPPPTHFFQGPEMVPVVNGGRGLRRTDSAPSEQALLGSAELRPDDDVEAEKMGGSRFRASLLKGEPGVSIEFGKFVAFISVSGVHFRRVHWFLLAVVVLVVVLLVAVLLPSLEEAHLQTPETSLVAAHRLLQEVPLVDGHNDLAWNIRKFIHNKLYAVNFTYDLRNISPWSHSPWSHTDLNRLRQGRVGAQLWVAYAPCGSQHRDAVQLTLEQIDVIKRLIASYPDYLMLAKDSSSLLKAHSEGKTASLIAVESGHAIGTSLAVLRMFHRLGARSLTLTHNCNTPWADSSRVDAPGGRPQHHGLTAFGKTVIKELNRLGMVIDLSHSSHQTCLDALESSAAPVIFSHSSVYALCNSTRNVRDDLLKLTARKGGLVMVNFFSNFLTCSNASTIHDVVSHLTYIKDVAGPDHVGIGASYDGINATPVGLEDVSRYPYLFAHLLSSGQWTQEELRKLAGLNFLRVLRSVEEVSQRLQNDEDPSEEYIASEDLEDYLNCRSGTLSKRNTANTIC